MRKVTVFLSSLELLCEHVSLKSKMIVLKRNTNLKESFNDLLVESHSQRRLLVSDMSNRNMIKVRALLTEANIVLGWLHYTTRARAHTLTHTEQSHFVWVLSHLQHVPLWWSMNGSAISDNGEQEEQEEEKLEVESWPQIWKKCDVSLCQEFQVWKNTTFTEAACRHVKKSLHFFPPTHKLFFFLTFHTLV